MSRKKVFRNKLGSKGRGRFALSKILLYLALFLLPAFVLLIIIGSRKNSWHQSEPLRLLVMQVDKSSRLRAVDTVHLMPDRRRLVVVGIPLGIKIPVVRGYGQYRVEAIWRLGEIENWGDTLLTESMEHLIGVRFERSLVIEVGDQTYQGNELIDKISRKLILGAVMRPLDWYESILIYREMSQDLRERVVMREPDSDRLLIRDTDVSGIETLRFDMLQFDAWLETLIMPIDSEFGRIGVVVENTTVQPGMAAHWSRFVRFGGFDLLGIQSSDFSLKDSLVIFADSDIANSVGGVSLQRLYPDFEVIVGNLDEYRADVLVRVGEDAAQAFNYRGSGD